MSNMLIVTTAFGCEIAPAGNFSGNAVKTVRCSYNALHDPLRLTMLLGNGALEKTRQLSEQRPLYGQGVQGRYIPFNTAVTAHQLSRHRQSWGLRSPGGRWRQRGISSQRGETRRQDRHATRRDRRTISP